MGWLRKASLFTDAGTVAGGSMMLTMDPTGGGVNSRAILYPDSSYASYATAGFGRNELVYSCIMEKAQSLPQGVMRVYPKQTRGGGNEPLEDNRLRQLLSAPNPITTEFEFLELSQVYLDLSGSVHWLKVRARDGVPAQLWPIRPDLIRILPSPRPYVHDWGIVLDPTSTTAASSSIIPVPFEDIIQIKYPNPLDAYFGQPPMRPAARAVSVDNAASDFVDKLLRNDACPRTVVTLANKIDEGILDLLKTKWKQRFGGENYGSPAFLAYGMDVKTLGLNLEQLEFPDLRSQNEARICMAFGVPPILVGAKVGLDRSTFSNYKEARAAFWEETLMPLQRRFIEPVRTKLLPDFVGVGRSSIRVDWDNSEVLALREAESEKWTRATEALARGAITINDHHRIVGLDPVENGDVFLLPAGSTPIPADSAAAVPPIETPGAPAGALPPGKGLPESGSDAEQQLIATILSKNGKGAAHV